MAGRKPQPLHLKLVKGNPGRRPINDAEPKPPRAVPDAPGHLTPHAQAAWGRLAPLLDRMGVLTLADALALERLCECYAEVRDAQAAIEFHGGAAYATKSVTGETLFRGRPEVAQLADADRRLKSYLSEFGLTPAARTKVRVDPAGAADPLDKYFG